MYQVGNTALLIAAQNGCLAVVEYLLERGADMEAKDKVNAVMMGVKLHT